MVAERSATYRCGLSRLEALLVFLAQELRRKERRALLDPVYWLWAYHRKFGVGDAVGDKPGIEHALAHATRPAGGKRVHIGRVNLLAKLVEQREQPRAIGIEHACRHHEHVEDVHPRRLHEAIPGRQVLRAPLPDDAAHLVELRAVHGMRVVVVDRLDVVVALPRENHVPAAEEREQLKPVNELLVGVLAALLRLVRAPQEPSVVDEALVLGVAVLPEPVEAGELTVAGVEGGDVVARVIALHIRQYIRMELCSHVQRQVDWVIRHLVRLMRGDCHYYRVQNLSPIPSFGHTITPAKQSYEVATLFFLMRQTHRYDTPSVTRNAPTIVHRCSTPRFPSKYPTAIITNW